MCPCFTTRIADDGSRLQGNTADDGAAQGSSVKCVQGPVTTAGGQKLGRVIDMSWVPMPHPVSGGSAIAVATDDGAIALVDVAQSADQSSRRQRCANTPKLSIARMTCPHLQWLELTDSVGQRVRHP